jgi:hypothetical protein
MAGAVEGACLGQDKWRYSLLALVFPLTTRYSQLAAHSAKWQRPASHCHLRLDALNVNCNEGGQAPHDASGGAVEFRKCDRWD